MPFELTKALKLGGLFAVAALALSACIIVVDNDDDDDYDDDVKVDISMDGRADYQLGA